MACEGRVGGHSIFLFRFEGFGPRSREWASLNRGVVALNGRAGRDSSLGVRVRAGVGGRGRRGAVALVSGGANRGSSLENGGRVGLNSGGEE